MHLLIYGAIKKIKFLKFFSAIQKQKRYTTTITYYLNKKMYYRINLFDINDDTR